MDELPGFFFLVLYFVWIYIEFAVCEDFFTRYIFFSNAPEFDKFDPFDQFDSFPSFFCHLGQVSQQL